MIPSLTSPDVFACHCEPLGGCIRVGILLFSEDFKAGTHTLYGETGHYYRLVIPLVPSPAYNIELSYADIQNPSQA